MLAKNSQYHQRKSRFVGVKQHAPMLFSSKELRPVFYSTILYLSSLQEVTTTRMWLGTMRVAASGG
jgi:hypothetical protein